MYSLGLGVSPFPVAPPLLAGLREHAAEKAYLPVRGHHDLRRAIASYLERTAAVDRTAEDVLIGPGNKALFHVLQLTFDGELVVSNPSWGAHAAQARLTGRTLKRLPTRAKDGWLLHADTLDAHCRDSKSRARVVLLNYPGNPSGTTYKPEGLKALARVARDHDAVLLSDEIYGELHHKGEHVSVARYYPEGTIVSTGLSKWCGAEGWRLDAMSAVASETFTSTAAPIQYAAVAAFEDSPEIGEYLANARRILSSLGRWSARRLRSAGLVCAQPTGGFYIYVSFDEVRARLESAGIRDDWALCARLLEDTGVALLPGSAFGTERERLCARLAYVDFDGARALKAVEVIPVEQPLDRIFLKRHCPRVVRAVDALCRWVEALG